MLRFLMGRIGGLWACFLLMALPVWSQGHDYIPLSRDLPDASEVLAQQRLRLKSAHKELRGEKSLQELHTQRFQRLEQQIQNEEFIYDARFQDFLGGILGEILAANPEIPAPEVRLFLSGQPWPNAYCTGTGNFIFNLGLLRRLDNESQIAFVLCHELAHFQLDHVDRAMRAHCERLESDATKDRIREIQRMEYGARTKALGLVQGLVFETRRHSRYAESAADSLGLIFLGRTRFNPHDAISCLAILDAIDEPKYGAPFDPQRLFPHPDYPFRERWQPSSDGFIYGKPTEIFDADSLKTHPECQDRIRALAPVLSGLPSRPNTQTETLAELVRIADFEVVETHFQNGNLGQALYAADQLLRLHPDHPWLVRRVGACFLGFYRGRKNHHLNRYLETPSPRESGAYQEMLAILNQLRMSEMARAGFYYPAAHRGAIHDHEAGWATYVRLAEAAGKTEIAAEAAAQYTENFPQGTLLNSK